MAKGSIHRFRIYIRRKQIESGRTRKGHKLSDDKLDRLRREIIDLEHCRDDNTKGSALVRMNRPLRIKMQRLARQRQRSASLRERFHKWADKSLCSFDTPSGTGTSSQRQLSLREMISNIQTAKSRCSFGTPSGTGTSSQRQLSLREMLSNIQTANPGKA